MRVFLAFAGLLFFLDVLAQEKNDIDSIKHYFEKGQSARALPFAKRHFETVKHTRNRDSNYIAAASRLGDIYVRLVKLDSALVYYEKAAGEAKKLYGDTSAQYGYHLVTVAAMYRNLTQYQEAEQRFQEATAILGRIDSSYYKGASADHKNFFTSYLIHYGAFYLKTGSLNKAEELCVLAYETALKEPVDVNAYAFAMNVLAMLYGKMGLYAKQDTILMRLFEINKEIYGEEQSKYTNAIGGLADIHQRKRNFEQADSMFRKTLALNQQLLGKNAADNIPVLNRLGIVNMEMRKYKIAEKYLKEAAEIIDENGGEKFGLFPYCMKNLARLYALTGRKKLAEPLFHKCLAIYDGLGLTLHSDRLSLLRDMAGLLYADDPAKAAMYLQEVLIAEKKLLLEKLDFLSEPELLAYLKATRDIADSPYRFLLQNKSAAIAGAAYNSRLFASGIGLQNTRTLYQNMSQSKDSTLAILWKNYLQQKSFFINLLLTPATRRTINTDSAADALNRQEKNILRRSADYRNMKEKLAITWQDVQKHLQPNEAAIEFVKFSGKQNAYTSAGEDKVYYAALLLRQQDTVPRFVALCEEKQLVAAMKKFPYKAVVTSRGKKTTADNPVSTNALHQLIWQPLESYLTHTRTIYFSPAGMLQRVAFAAIPDKKNKLLCDKFNLVQLTSTRQIALHESQPSAPVAIALFGGINYNHQSANAGLDAYTHSYNRNRSADIDSFPFLPNTLKEINTIKTDAEALQNRSVVFTGDEATETAFRNLGGDHSPEVIHFATHGFAVPDMIRGNNTDAPFKTSDNPLLRCGLVMAGGNKGWKGKTSPGEDDGILTGLEISTVQLPRTQLTVLSACETGLGTIEGNEGVFGLQRAFKLAGVNYIMASLWQVPDKETAEFMETFYARWLGGKTIREAFFNTQQIMRKKYAPYYWAGFTLVQ
ncbi:MAG: CHAT domain-containing protein [Agriterribacter sp.]